MRRLSRLAITSALGLVFALLPGPASAHEGEGPPSSSTCRLDNGVQHVIFIVFDNTHFVRDNPNVPSDLEQMPHLLNFLKDQGTVLTNEHTPLIAHTATDILTSLTGVYGDRHGVPISNSFRYYNPNGTTGLGVSFAYWTAPIFDPTTSAATDTTFNMLTAQGKNAPAPWAPYTRAGCNVGGVATANIELENTGIDIPTVFGAGSPEAIEAAANPDLATGDFVGIAVHCAKEAALCSTSTHARPDLLPQEPGGYHGYQGLFGHKYVAPAVGGISAIDGSAIPTFPGFDGMIANRTLGYVATMQEHGVPVTYGYISDAHAGHTGTPADRPFGPGEAGYVAQLKQYDDSFAAFFANLEAHGINRSNTIFTFTSDEGDHLIAGPPSPSNCDGVNVPCTYAKIGEVSGNLTGIIATQKGITTPFKAHADSAINVYVTGNPAPTAAAARDLERAAGTVTAVNPYSGVTETIDNTLADRAEMNLLHMHTADPNRDPTFTMFAKPDYFLFAGAPNCTFPCISINPAFNWNHGDIAPEINTTWLGFVGPGVANLGVDNRVWTDHADIRPTILSLIGLRDDYSHQGRVITQIMGESGDGESRMQQDDGLNALGAIYKQINAPVGQLSLDSLVFATRATLSGTDTSDGRYVEADARIAGWTTRRNALARQMESVLEGAEFRGRGPSEERVSSLIERAQVLLNEVHAAAA
jgi:hypothetical protein